MNPKQGFIYEPCWDSYMNPPGVHIQGSYFVVWGSYLGFLSCRFGRGRHRPPGVARGHLEAARGRQRPPEGPQRTQGLPQKHRGGPKRPPRVSQRPQ
jgi:hypothetical protein